MVFVRRDEQNEIIAILDHCEDATTESISPDDPALLAFLVRCNLGKTNTFLKTDLELIRVIEDLIKILMDKNIIAITDFPSAAMEKLIKRDKIRAKFNSITGIMDNSSEK